MVFWRFSRERGRTNARGSRMKGSGAYLRGHAGSFSSDRVQGGRCLCGKQSFLRRLSFQLSGHRRPEAGFRRAGKYRSFVLKNPENIPYLAEGHAPAFVLCVHAPDLPASVLCFYGGGRTFSNGQSKEFYASGYRGGSNSWTAGSRSFSGNGSGTMPLIPTSF